ncbi:hypothetical protein [Sodalis sp. RH16]|uniref:hypothetical protein n=1 Tax=Sodalis sp. RH16 TaxID=3394331 RepID=UPI0039B47491
MPHNQASQGTGSSPIRDPRILDVIARMYSSRRSPPPHAFQGAPQLRIGGYVLNDNAEPDFLAYIRHPQNGFISISLPIKRGTELALKVA